MKNNASLIEWEKVFRLLGNPVIIIDREQNIVSANKAVEKDAGKTEKELIGNKCYRVFHNANEPPERCPFLKLIETSASECEEMPVEECGKTCIVSVAPLYEKDGGFTHVVHSMTDITFQKAAERALRASEKHYRFLAEDATDIILKLGPDGKILFSTPSAERILGYEPEEMYMRPLDNFCWTETGAESDTLSAAVAASRDTFRKSHRMIRKNGSEIWVETIGRLIRDGAGAVLETHCVIRDISDRVKARDAEMKLQDYEKQAALGRVAGKIAHDFNNILAIILGASELLLSDDLPSEIREELEIIRDTAYRGRDITATLKHFAIDKEAKVSLININERIRALIDSMKPDFGNAEVIFSPGDDGEFALADEEMIDASLKALIQNALHAMSKTPNPLLQIKTYNDNNKIFIEIEDNGCGVPREHMDKIFEPAVTLKGGFDKTNSYSGGIKGAGYGLTNAKRCLDRHRGGISLVSEPGKGTRVIVSIPSFTEELGQDEIRKIQLGEDAWGKNILVVEDEPHLARIIHSLLENFGHNIHLAHDGTTALSLLEKNAYDIVSLDYLLPDITGMEVYKKIRERDKDIPVVFVSGNFEFMQSIANLKNDDANVGLLAKPFANIEYISAIHNRLST